MPKQTKTLKEQPLKKKAKQPIGKSKTSLKEPSLEYDHISFIEETRDILSPLEGLKGFELYKNWRNTLFGMLRGIIENNQTERANALSGASNIIESEFDIFYECGFFHEAYKHNFHLSADIFVSHFEDKDEINRLQEIVDLYVLPKSEKTQDFGNSFSKGLAATMAYIMIDGQKCSEHLSVFISKQVFGFQSDQTAYEHLKEIKKHFSTNKKIPISLYLALFYALFTKKVDWTAIKARAKQERSISELRTALDHLDSIRKRLVEQEITNAQKSLLDNKELFEGVMEFEFMSKILNFDSHRTIIDDEFVLGVLCASFLRNKIFASLIPTKN